MKTPTELRRIAKKLNSIDGGFVANGTHYYRARVSNVAEYANEIWARLTPTDKLMNSWDDGRWEKITPYIGELEAV